MLDWVVATTLIRLLKLTHQPRLENARVVLVDGEVFLDEFRIQVAPVGDCELVAHRHLSALDVGADDDLIHRPVERAKTLRVVAG
jgi:hypothetical protein